MKKIFLITVYCLLLTAYCLPQGKAWWWKYSKVNWSPDEILWNPYYDSDMGITLETGVKIWADQSGNNVAVSQSVGNNQPLYKNNDLNMHGVLIFDGLNDVLANASSPLNQPVSYVLVMKQLTWTFGDRIFEGYASGVNMVRQLGSSPTLSISSGSAFNVDLQLDTWVVFIVVFNGASSKAIVNNNNATVGNAGVTNATGITIGGNIGSAFSHIAIAWFGRYAGDITANVEYSNLKNYLYNRYAITP